VRDCRRRPGIIGIIRVFRVVRVTRVIKLFKVNRVIMAVFMRGWGTIMAVFMRDWGREYGSIYAGLGPRIWQYLCGTGAANMAVIS
jgi:hypothetical protein